VNYFAFVINDNPMVILIRDSNLPLYRGSMAEFSSYHQPDVVRVVLVKYLERGPSRSKIIGELRVCPVSGRE
jgi:hypothetical protein